MVKYFLLSISFLTIAAPSYGGPPSDNYGPGLDLLKQAAGQLVLAQSLTADPDSWYYDPAVVAIVDAIAAAENATANGVRGGVAKKNADFAAFNALATALIAHYLHSVETNADAAAYWLEASNSALQGAILLDRSISREWPH